MWPRRHKADLLKKENEIKKGENNASCWNECGHWGKGGLIQREWWESETDVDISILITSVIFYQALKIQSWAYRLCLLAVIISHLAASRLLFQNWVNGKLGLARRLAQPHPAPTNITCWDFYRVSPHPQSQGQHAIFRKSPLQKRPITHLSLTWSIMSDDARQTVITSEGGEVKEVAVDEKGSHQYCMDTRPP